MIWCKGGVNLRSLSQRLHELMKWSPGWENFEAEVECNSRNIIHKTTRTSIISGPNRVNFLANRQLPLKLLVE